MDFWLIAGLIGAALLLLIVLGSLLSLRSWRRGGDRPAEPADTT